MMKPTGLLQVIQKWQLTIAVLMLLLPPLIFGVALAEGSYGIAVLAVFLSAMAAVVAFRFRLWSTLKPTSANDEALAMTEKNDSKKKSFPDPVVTRYTADYEESGEMPDEMSDQARLMDDTQASILFNKTADSIVDLIHQTLKAHSTFFYLFNYQGPEFILQSYRSESPDFTPRSTLPMAPETRGMHYFRQAAENRELQIIAIPEGPVDLPYYSRPVAVRSMMLSPLLRRGTLLGLIGVDHREPAAFGDEQVQILHKYTGLLRHSIHSIDAVFVKNRLSRMASAIREFGDFIRHTDQEENIFNRLRTILASLIGYQRYTLWNYNPKTQTLVPGDSDSQRDVASVTDYSRRHLLERYVLQTRQTMYIPGTADYVFPHGMDRERIAGQYLNAVLCLPVMDQDQCYGVLALEWEEKNPLDLHQIQFAESLSHLTGLALSRIYLDQSLASEMATDPLTGIDHQGTFFKKLNAEIYRAKRFHTTFSLILLEVQQLGRITEQYGNRFRHFILEKTAQIIRQSLRQVDIAARLDNDRMAIILIESPYAQTQECAARIRKQIEMSAYAIDDILIPVRAQTGTAQFGVHGETAENLFEAAETELKKANEIHSR